jgi:hypothetical protein
MKKRLKGLYILISSLVIGLISLPFALAKSATGSRTTYHSVIAPARRIMAQTGGMAPVLKSAYDSLSLGVKGLSREAFDYARKGFNKLLDQGKLVNDSIISIIDFSQPSSHKRLYVLDLKNDKVLFNTLVAHGRNSGREYASNFSNQNSSFMSSPGFYVTRETYEGHNGYSLKLDGVERGINDNAYERGIVVHGAPYVSEAIVNMQGYAGRSQGCPAVPLQTSAPLINTIKNGSCMFIYAPSYVRKSTLLEG